MSLNCYTMHCMLTFGQLRLTAVAVQGFFRDSQSVSPSWTFRQSDVLANLVEIAQDLHNMGKTGQCPRWS